MPNGSWLTVAVNITGSSISGPHNAILVGGTSAIVSVSDEDASENVQDQEAYGGPGLVFRPRAPEQVETPDGTQEIGAEAMCARIGDSMVPLAWRDLRFNRVFPSPGEGTVALVGYGGAFLAMDDTDSREGNRTTFYCPYSFSGGVAGKAHAIIMDPVEESITIVHGDGQTVLMQNDGTIRLQSPDGQTYIQLSNGAVFISADQLVLNGTVVVGDPTGPIVPMTPGASSPPCPRLWVNPAA